MEGSDTNALFFKLLFVTKLHLVASLAQFLVQNWCSEEERIGKIHVFTHNSQTKVSQKRTNKKVFSRYRLDNTIHRLQKLSNMITPRSNFILSYYSLSNSAWLFFSSIFMPEVEVLKRSFLLKIKEIQGNTRKITEKA